MTDGLRIGAIEWRAWADEVVVYVHETAETHWLTADAARVFKALLLDVGVSGPALNGDDDAVLVSASLAEFERIGLMTRRAP
ncbi:MAG: hypothetical protein V4792_18115 [Pseudomonadota bacterium]